MPAIRLRRTALRASLGALVILVASACATRRPETIVPPMPVSRTIVWRVGEGDVIRVRIYREPDLSGESPVNVNGTAFFPGIGRIAVAGLTLDSLQADLSARYGKFIIDAAVDVTLQRDIVVYGQARAPGVYMADPSTTVLGFLAKAGGAVGSARTPIVTLIKADGRSFRLPTEGRLAMMDITRSDAIYVQEGDFFARNQASVAAMSLMVSVAVSLVSLVVILTR